MAAVLVVFIPGAGSVATSFGANEGSASTWMHVQSVVPRMNARVVHSSCTARKTDSKFSAWSVGRTVGRGDGARRRVTRREW